MDYCHQHNLVDPSIAAVSTDEHRRYGIRVTLPKTDTLRKVLGDDWEQVHWFTTEADRDKAFDSMAERHGYYRRTDDPTQVLEKIER